MAPENDRPAEAATFSVDRIGVSKFHVNTEIVGVVITHDKLENILLKHSSRLESGRAWQTPLGLLFSMILALSTADHFKPLFGMDGVVWQAFFLLVAIASAGWLLRALGKCWHNRKKATIEFLIREIEAQERV